MLDKKTARMKTAAIYFKTAMLSVLLAIFMAAYAAPDVETAKTPPEPAAAASPYGLWQGTVGTQEVMIKLASTEQCDDTAGYYYSKHPVSIPLKSRNQGIEWVELPDDADASEKSQVATWTFSGSSSFQVDLRI